MQDPIDLWEKVRKKPRVFVVGLAAIAVTGFAYHSGGYFAKRVFDSMDAHDVPMMAALKNSAEKSTGHGSQTVDSPEARTAPSTVTAAQPSAAGQKAPSHSLVVPRSGLEQANSSLPSRAPEQPGPCAHLRHPVTPAALSTSVDRICAIAMCTGQAHDAPLIVALRSWLELANAKAAVKCDVADREALGDDAILKRLLAIAGGEPTPHRANEKSSCLDARQAVNDEVQRASERLHVGIEDGKRCGSKAQQEISQRVSVVVQALQ